MISNQLLAELQQILKEEYAMDLSQTEVEEMGKLLLSYFKTLTQIEESQMTKGGEK